MVDSKEKPKKRQIKRFQDEIFIKGSNNGYTKGRTIDPYWISSNSHVLTQIVKEECEDHSVHTLGCKRNLQDTNVEFDSDLTLRSRNISEMNLWFLIK